MLKKIQVETLLVSTTENGEDILRSEAQGGCLIEDDGLMVRYAEMQNNGTATLVLTDSLADLRRQGDTSSRLTFVEGKLIDCFYRTPQGELSLSLYTHSQQFAVDAQGGHFEARYTLLAAGQQVADNVLTVKWTYMPA